MEATMEPGRRIVRLAMKPPTLQTGRLLLRRWTDDDRDVFAGINADPEVMRYRFKPLTRQASDELIDRIEACFEMHDFGQWAVERIDDRRIIGFVGLEVADDETLFSPPVHIGWNLARDAWGHGYATEAAAAALDYVFGVVGLPEVVAHTTAVNERSRAVMARLGMEHTSDDDFDGPWYPPRHPFRRFVLSRMTAAEWPARRPTGPRPSGDTAGAQTP
jgi:RimJ/RimL family protein N-acetyltransferase